MVPSAVALCACTLPDTEASAAMVPDAVASCACTLPETEASAAMVPSAVASCACTLPEAEASAAMVPVAVALCACKGNDIIEDEHQSGQTCHDDEKRGTEWLPVFGKRENEQRDETERRTGYDREDASHKPGHGYDQPDEDDGKRKDRFHFI